MTKKRANCYKCKYRGGVPKSTHSSCYHPGNAIDLKIKAEPYGVSEGWFMWPSDFDPVWLENCDGFTPKSEIIPKEEGL